MRPLALGRSSWPEVLDQRRQLQQVLTTQTSPARRQDDEGIFRCQTRPAYRYGSLVAIDVRIEHAPLAPLHAAGEHFQDLAVPGVERVRDAHRIGGHPRGATCSLSRLRRRGPRGWPTTAGTAVVAWPGLQAAERSGAVRWPAAGSVSRRRRRSPACGPSAWVPCTETAVRPDRRGASSAMASAPLSSRTPRLPSCWMSRTAASSMGCWICSSVGGGTATEVGWPPSGMRMWRCGCSLRGAAVRVERRDARIRDQAVALP